MRHILSLSCMLLAACVGQPAVSELPLAELTGKPPLPAHPEAEATALPVEPLELKGVNGGQIVFRLRGRPEQILEMLLDFENADGNRPWAKSYELLARTEDGAVARWRFKGRMGIHPTISLVFRVERDRDSIRMTFHQRKPVFGLSAFFGDYRIWQAAGDSESSFLAERVFIDSGVFFANASKKDVANGLREDAKRTRKWMAMRLEAGPRAAEPSQPPSRARVLPSAGRSSERSGSSRAR